VHATFEADTFFEPINENDWLLLEKIPFKKSEKNEFDFDFLVYKRK